MSVAEFRRRTTRGNKYSATAVVENGLRFDSKLERDRYLYWNNLWRVGAIQYFIRQVPFHLPGGIVYRLDFLVVSKAGHQPPLTYEDCKGKLTRVSINKIRQVEALYGIEVELIKRGDWRT